jgi:hypothetical protein
MLKKLEPLALRAAREGWDRPAIQRLIAAVEEDGVESPRETAALSSLLEDPHLGSAARREIGRLLGFAALARPLQLPPAGSSSAPRSIFSGPGGLDEARYQAHVEILAGERPAEVGGRTIFFRDRFLPSPGHQLSEVVAWLEAYYAGLGLETERQAVPWRGQIYSNLLVRLPGRRPEAVLLCDHYDVADKEHLVRRNLPQLSRDHALSRREIAARMGRLPLGAAVPGADDNASATAALMEVGAVLAGAGAGARGGAGGLERTIELVHLVGEELPADCLGARTLLHERSPKAPIAAAIVLDMIGVDRTGRRKIQLSAGRPAASLALAAELKRAIGELGIDLRPVLRPYGARRSFLHQTDGIHFSRAGIPVLLVNEHLNDDRDRYRIGYHDEFDTTRLMDFGYAAAVARAAGETVYRLAACTGRWGHAITGSARRFRSLADGRGVPDDQETVSEPLP